MEKRKFFILRALDHAEFREEQPGLDPPKGPTSVSGSLESASAAAPSAATPDWKIISKAEATLGEEFNYTEYVMGSPGESGQRPIVGDDQESCIMVMDLPDPADTRRITMTLEDTQSGFSDTVEMKKVLGNFDEFKINLSSILIHQGTGFFTVDPGPGQLFETYVNIGLPGHVAKLSYSDIDTFDQFRFSLLVQMM